MAVTYSLNQQDVLFRIKVTDCLTDTAFDKVNIASQKIVFYKPDGTTFEKTAELITDPQTPAESFVQYQNAPPEESILDLRGSWEYAAELTLTSTGVAQTSQRRVAWVV